MAFFELLVEVVGRRSLPSLILSQYLLFVRIPLLKMDLIILCLLHRLHHHPLMTCLAQVLLGPAVDAEYVIMLSLLGLLPTLRNLLQIGLIPAQLLPGLYLISPPAILLLGVALPQVLLLLLIGLGQSIADVGIDLPFLHLLLLQQALRLLLFLHVYLQSPQLILQQFFRDPLARLDRHLVEILCLEEGLSLELQVDCGVEDRLVGDFLQQIGRAMTRNVHLSIRIYKLSSNSTCSTRGEEAYFRRGGGWVDVCYLMFNKMDDQQLQEEVLWLVGSIKDPEKSHCTLQDLEVINNQSVTILHIPQLQKRQGEGDAHGDEKRRALRVIEVKLKPTNAHCHLIQQIALAVHLRLRRQLPHHQQFKVRVACFPQSHAKQQEVEKQMNDKQRIAAALENQQIVQYLDGLLS